MVVKPGEIDSKVIDSLERQVTRLEAEVDKKVSMNPQTDTHRVLLYDIMSEQNSQYTNHRLVERYKRAGWKYVTVYVDRDRKGSGNPYYEMYLSMSERLKFGIVRDSAGTRVSSKSWIVAGDKAHFDKVPEDSIWETSTGRTALFWLKALAALLLLIVLLSLGI